MNTKRSVLFMLPSFNGGGAERVISHLVNHLDRQRYAPMLALGAPRGPFLKDVRDDVPIYHLGAERARTAVLAVIRAAWSLRPNVIISTLGLNLAVALARPLFPQGIRVILREGNSISAFLAEVARSSRTRASLYRRFYQTFYGRADTVVCQSNFMLEDLAASVGLPRSKMVRIYNPVDIMKIRALADQGTISYPGRGPHLISIGRLSYQKGYDILLNAFSRVRREHPGASLSILGEGEDRDDLERLARRLGLEGTVHFLGFQSNPYVHLKATDLFVSSSRYEGFSNVILEAMACGTPVVATDCPSGNREVIEEGVTGWLARAEDVDSLAETISRAIVERVRLDSKLIQARCESLYSVARVTALYEAQL
jgi:glycosyltransferase involved in cell wall biosynthesis